MTTATFERNDVDTLRRQSIDRRQSEAAAAEKAYTDLVRGAARHGLPTDSEAIEAVSGLVRRYEELIPAEYRLSK